MIKNENDHAYAGRRIIAAALEKKHKKHHKPYHPSGKHTHEVIFEGLRNVTMSKKEVAEHLLQGVRNHNFLNEHQRNEVLADSYAQLEQALYHWEDSKLSKEEIEKRLVTKEMEIYKTHLFSAITDYHA